MVWAIFFIIAVFVTIVFTKLKNIKRLWIMGLVTMLFLYIIDSTFITLGAYSYRDSSFILNGIPIFFLLSGFSGGILLAYFYPTRNWSQLPYILLSSAIFLFLEIIMNRMGYIRYIKWNSIKSYFLDIVGFMAILWLGQWLNATGKGK